MTDWNQNKNPHSKVVGLLPAGGKAKRIAPLPCSKELFPIGCQDLRQDLGIRPKVVSHYLLEKMRLASVTKVYIVLRKGKYLDIGTPEDLIKAIQITQKMMPLPAASPGELEPKRD
jgi:glucose-1-phosphate thymidylyltransferase